MGMQAAHGRRLSLWAVGIPAAVHFLLHILTNGNYGIFRDELYYLACADHLAWGYVDQPPLSIAILAVSKALLGDSVQAIRLIPALVGSALIVLTGLMARRLGGGTFAQFLAALSVMIVPSYLVMTGFYSMNAFDLLFWAIIFYLLIVLIQTDNPKLWIWIGVAIGLGALNKISVLVLATALAAGVVLTPLRRYLRSKHLWLGAVIAVLVFLPHILWQLANGWPTLAFIANAKAYKIVQQSLPAFILEQMLHIHPVNLIIWVIGLASLLFVRPLSRYRIFGIIYIATFVILVVQNSKAYYLVPAYSILLAAGACTFSAFSRGRGWGWLRGVLPVIIIVGGAATLPIALPLMEPEAFLEYQATLGIASRPAEVGHTGAMPQHYADRFDWDTLAETVAAVYQSLPADERDSCIVAATDYGLAGAIDYYRDDYGLPPVISGHNNYFLWGPGDIVPEVVIAVGLDREDAESIFGSVTSAATLPASYNLSFDDPEIFICRDWLIPFEQAWQEFRIFI